MDAQALLDSLDFGVAVVDAGHRVLEWSAAAARLTGIPAGRAVGHDVRAVLPTSRGSGIERALESAATERGPWTYVLREGSTGGAAPVLETWVMRDAAGQLVVVFRQALSELDPDSRATHVLAAYEAERRRYHQLFDSLPSAALVLSAAGEVLEANAEGTQLLGAKDPATIHGHRLGEWVAAAQQGDLREGLRRAAAGREQVPLTLALVRGAREEREVRAVLVTVDPDRSPPLVLFLALDVSREQLLQRRLVRADRLSLLGALVSGVAHELNNPLAAIAAFAEGLVTGPTLADLQESAQIIRSEALRAGRIVQTLLDFARLRPRTPGAVDLEEVCGRVLSLQRNACRKAGVTVHTSFPADLPPVAGDAQELQQVLLNLVVNARQAIQGTGRPGDLTLAARRTDDHVLVTVDDTGPGIPPEILDRVFEPFFTTKGEGGTGLGLAISFGLVRGMGGRMWVQNLDAGGARISLELPAERRRAPPPEPPAPRGPSRQLSVLVVDDDENVRRAMALLARRLGHEVTSAATYADAMAQLRDPGARFDAVLLDVHLDGTHTGFEVFDRLHLEGEGRDRAVLFTTGDSISTLTRDALERADRPVLRKPFGLEDLREILERVATP